MKSKLKSLLYLARFILLIPGYDRKNELINKDLKRWKSIYNLHTSNIYALAWLLWTKKEFRNLYIYRNSSKLLYRTLIKIIYHPLDTLFIETPVIGGGLFIQHGFSTMISASSIGENCWINQQVTIGYKNKGGPPKIGNNVTITCGAKVLGNIVVGDNSTIGSNAVVIKNVEANSVMVGIPAKKMNSR